MHRDLALLERDPRAALRHVERVADAEDPGLERQRLAVGAMARDRLQHLGDDHRAVGLLVDPVEQLAELRLGEEEAPVLVAAPVDGHPDAVRQRGEHDDDLGVLVPHPVVADDRRLDPVLRELAEELQRDVGDDLDVHPGVVVDLQPDDRVDVGDVPPALQLRVGVRPLEHASELPVAALREPDPHVLHRLRRRQPCLADRRVRGGLLDPLLGLGVERHASAGAGSPPCASRSRK